MDLSSLPLTMVLVSADTAKHVTAAGGEKEQRQSENMTTLIHHRVYLCVYRYSLAQ